MRIVSWNINGIRSLLEAPGELFAPAQAAQGRPVLGRLAPEEACRAVADTLARAGGLADAQATPFDQILYRLGGGPRCGAGCPCAEPGEAANPDIGPGFYDLPDIVCLQETRVQRDTLPEAACRVGLYDGYFAFVHATGRGGYSGVATLVRRPAGRAACSKLPCPREGVWSVSEAMSSLLEPTEAESTAALAAGHSVDDWRVALAHEAGLQPGRLRTLDSEGRAVLTMHGRPGGADGTSDSRFLLVNVYIPHADDSLQVDASAGDASELERLLFKLDFLCLLRARLDRMCIAAGPAQTTGPLTDPTLLAFQIFGGFFANQSGMLVWLRWLQYISPHKWSFQALMVNEFRDRVITCTPEEMIMTPSGPICPVTTGEDLLRNFGFDPSLRAMWKSVWMLAILFVGIRILGWLMFEFQSWRTTARRSRKLTNLVGPPEPLSGGASGDGGAPAVSAASGTCAAAAAAAAVDDGDGDGDHHTQAACTSDDTATVPDNAGALDQGTGASSGDIDRSISTAEPTEPGQAAQPAICDVFASHPLAGNSASPFLVDSFRHFFPESPAEYTCWDMRALARRQGSSLANGPGSRIDYILTDRSMVPGMAGSHPWRLAQAIQCPRNHPRVSDHAAVVVDFAWADDHCPRVEARALAERASAAGTYSPPGPCSRHYPPIGHDPQQKSIASFFAAPSASGPPCPDEAASVGPPGPGPGVTPAARPTGLGSRPGPVPGPRPARRMPARPGPTGKARPPAGASRAISSFFAAAPK
ncbi:hypothetical protein H696_04234 [Fonticula alba]|uniref:Uncharacterized protein n=1 Tax=Fonticula alba TaxID=691883 RepID=A0A058Z5L3_FONAL|nr:hypothetical protein H696_04234 [Fonticula alba]KCV68817.1 hypothetical protein H696_04234 [Fonticula alba]|eukprot:XP_009496388.1 hypothetical protein H696_04234 [Fonticula alba]